MNANREILLRFFRTCLNEKQIALLTPDNYVVAALAILYIGKTSPEDAVKMLQAFGFTHEEVSQAFTRMIEEYLQS
jgi:hypothetical protein